MAVPDGLYIRQFHGFAQACHVVGHWFSSRHAAHPESIMDESGLLRCVVRECSNMISIVAVTGVLDCQTAHALAGTLDGCIARGRHLVLSVSRVTEIDTAGVAVLVRAYHAARYHGLSFALFAVNGEVDAALQLYRLRALIPEYRRLSDVKQQACTG
jgi:anti-anti-sigma factor